MRVSLLISVSLALLAGAAAPALADAPRCADVVAAYNKLAGKAGVPDVLSGWTEANAATFRFHDAGGDGKPESESGLVCNPDGSLERFEFTLAWTGYPPTAAMVSGQRAAETVSVVVSPGGAAPNYQDLTDTALDNAQMLQLSTQSEWAPTGNGYEAFVSILRNAQGGGSTYGVRKQH